MKQAKAWLWAGYVVLIVVTAGRGAPIDTLRYRFEKLDPAANELKPIDMAAIFLTSPDREHEVRSRLTELGFDAATIETGGLAGTLIVSTDANTSSSERIRRFDTLLAESAIDYVAPIYAAPDGSQLAIAPQLSVFGHAADQAADDRADVTALPLDTKNGFQVLALAPQIAALPDVASVEPTWVLVASRNARYVVPEGVSNAVRYGNGAHAALPAETVWRPMCASPGAMTVNQLKEIAEANAAALALQPQPQDAVAGGGGFDLQFNILSALPDGAAESIAAIEEFLESVFDDPVTVVINLRFANLGSGVLGSTGSSYVSDSYPDVRDGLQADMDFDDFIQDFLPTTTTIPVRYNGNSEAVTAETRVFVTRANFNAAIGSVGGSAASMTFNTDFSWDYDPPRTTAGQHDFRSVLVHEVGHALGFTSGADFRFNDLEMLDLYRFQRSDGSGTDHNPDTLEEFEVEPRMVDQNAPGTLDDVNSDLISVEYQMSDGSPRQASHFHDQTPAIGIMDPTLASGQTFYPDYFLDSDREMFDAIGWDYPVTEPCEVTPVAPEPAATPKNRYMGFSPTPSGVPVALRVKLMTFLDPASGAPPASPDFSSFEGEVRWIGLPTEHTDSPTAGTTFLGSPLTCEPVCADWAEFGPIQVFGAEILPNSVYEIQVVDCACDLGDEQLYSAALTVTTAHWGDVTLPFRTDAQPTQPDFGDVAAEVSKFLDEFASISKPRAQLQPNLVSASSSIDFRDIADAVDAFVVGIYPYVGPCTCPSSVTCGATVCATDADCGGGLCIGSTCTDACGRCVP